MALKNITGQVAEGSNFFGRTKELKRALELLDDGNSLILAAPRRVGKTSFARKIKDTVIEKGWNGFYIDLQKPTTEFDFMKQFLKEIKGENWFEKHVLGAVDEVTVKDVALKFNAQKQDFYRKIEEALPYDEDTLIIFDELTVFLDDVLRKKDDSQNEFKDVLHFLNWLRGLRIASGSKIRWIFCSSISIESFAHKHSLSKTINDITPFKIGELKDDEPLLLVKALADSKKMSFSDELIHYMLEKLNWNLPYFIQILFREIVNLLEDEQPLLPKTIDEAYQNLLAIDINFNTWTERLSYYDDEKRFARIILNKLSKSKKAVKKDNLFDLVYIELNDHEKADEIFLPLLKQLETDGYIVSDKDKYTFRSSLLKDYWYNNFGK
ncbi:hypothetical protein AGMMS49965_14250 [Bacteroidia bacterium]|nr:hypothetical protein AGMMS49965_14250 [Bacteroidia bacterium]